MGITKNALIRFKTLDRCFRNPGKKYFINDLLEACNEALYEFDPNSEGIKKRQLYDDIRYMESEQGYAIPLEKIKDGRSTYYRYSDRKFSIANEPLNENEAEQLKSAMMVLSRFKGLPQFEWVNELLPKLDQTFKLSDQKEDILSFESNIFVEGTKHIAPLFNAILYKQALKIKYQSFKSNQPQTLIFHPYLLKQYNNRWFLFGKTEGFENLTNLALDRIVEIEDCKEKYKPNDFEDFEEYFEDIIGVSKSSNELTKITLNASPSIAPYIKTKPLHGSQKEIEDTPFRYTFSIEVIPNFELEKMLLSFGEDITVIEPKEFRLKIKKRLFDNLNNYN